MKLDRLFTRHKTVIIVIIFFVALTPRLYKIDSKNAWMDESKQAGLSNRSPFDFNLAEYASIQQQPPLDYFIQSILINNFGLNEIGIRLHAAILGAFAAVFFSLLLVRIRCNGPAIVLGLLVFIFHPLLIRYSQEGRPISTAVFFSILYLFFLVELLQTTESKTSPAKRFAVFTLIQVAFLLSVGFQPVIFLVVSLICLIPFLAVKEKRSRVLWIYLSSLSAFLISFPILNMTIRSGARFQYIKQATIPNMIKNVLHNIGNLKLDSVLNIYNIILEDYGSFFIVVIISGIIGFILNSKKRNHRFVVSYFAMFFFIYPLIYSIMFTALISWEIFPRYFLTFAPVCFILMTLAVYLSSETFKYIRTTSFPESLRFVIVFLLAGLVVYSFARNMMTVSNFYHLKKPEWKKMYDIFKYDSEPGDIAYMLNLVNIDSYSPDFRAKNLYYPVTQMRPVKLKPARIIPQDFMNPKLWKQGRNIYIVTRYGSHKIKESFFQGNKNIDFFLLKNITIIRIKKNSRTKENLISMLRILLANLPTDESNYFPYQLLINIDLATGNLDKAEKNIKVLEAMDSRKKLNELIRLFKKKILKLKEATVQGKI